MKWAKLFKLIGLSFITAVFYCEFLVYYVILFQCNWPIIALHNGSSSSLTPIKSMIIADTHLLGPFSGHWVDKFIREWHMHRAFQTSITIFRPDVIFILGDLFDEGYIVSDQYFRQYIHRYRKLFYTPQGTQVISVVGNHDVGFHYRMHPFFLDRFAKEFNNSGVHMHTIKNVHFVVVNSMAMENDHCSLCDEAQDELNKIGHKLMCMKDAKLHKCKEPPNSTYSRPILLQHFPTYRISDAVCEERDSPKIQRYKENQDVLSKESTQIIGNLLHPRLAFSGHTHHYCKYKNRLGIDEYSVASFSWRNKNNPSFMLAQFTPITHGVSKCDMPVQNTNLTIYISTFALCVTAIILKLFSTSIRKFHKKD